ncbi:MAG: hypothetical protein ABIB47_00215, partial [Candidatus Woesearchaeota archaeon]
MTNLQDYVLKGNPVIEVPTVGNLIYDELGKEVIRLHNERFQNITKIEDTHQYKQGEPILFSNTPRALSYVQILRELTNGRIQVLSPEQVVQYWDALLGRDATYADTDSIAVFPNEGPNENLRIRVLDILGRDPTKLEVPLLVQGLGVETAENDYGFTFTKTA